MICQDQYQRKFCPFVHEYFIRINTNISNVYTDISPPFILFMNVRPPIITIFPCSLLSNFFFCSSQRRKDINVIYHLTITAGFQLNRSGLEFKQTKAINFFPVYTTIRTGRVMWVAEQRQRGWGRRKPVFICPPFLTLNSTHHMYLWKRRETGKRLFPKMNQTWNKF